MHLGGITGRSLGEEELMGRIFSTQLLKQSSLSISVRSDPGGTEQVAKNSNTVESKQRHKVGPVKCQPERNGAKVMKARCNVPES